LIAQYSGMHRNGDRLKGISAEAMFAGYTSLQFVDAVKQLVSRTDAKRILDYGSGKGEQYRPRPIVSDGKVIAESVAEYWDVDEVRCYDPGYAPFRELPSDTFDGVVCTDVLEHCPEEDLEWIVSELFRFATRFVFATVACWPARKTLPDGQNAHVTIRPAEWWRERFAAAGARYPAIDWELRASVRSEARGGSIEREHRFEHLHITGRTGETVTVPRQPRPEPIPTIAVSVDGTTVLYEATNALTRWRAETVFSKEPLTLEWILGFDRGSVFVDVGSNVGTYAILAAVVRNAMTVAFEPEASNFAQLCRNISVNRVGDRVTAYCAALSNLRSAGRLYLSAEGTGGSVHSFGASVGHDLRERKSGATQGCFAFTLDELVSGGHCPAPNYVKVDVDGFEHLVVDGARETLGSENVKSVLVEVNPVLEPHRRMVNTLQSMGFKTSEHMADLTRRKSGPFAGVYELIFSR
jgi:FkbM family methyltransferase